MLLPTVTYPGDSSSRSTAACLYLRAETTLLGLPEENHLSRVAHAPPTCYCFCLVEEQKPGKISDGFNTANVVT